MSVRSSRLPGASSSGRRLTLLLLGAVLFYGAVVMYLAYERSGQPGNSHPTRFEQAVGALDRVKDWATWMTGLQTAAIAVVGYWLNRDGGYPVGGARHVLATTSLAAFGLSILVATWVLSCLPSLHERLVCGVSEDNDIFEMSINMIASQRRIRLGMLTTVFHAYFVLGALALGAFGLGRVAVPEKDPMPPDAPD